MILGSDSQRVGSGNLAGVGARLSLTSQAARSAQRRLSDRKRVSSSSCGSSSMPDDRAPNIYDLLWRSRRRFPLRIGIAPFEQSPGLELRLKLSLPHGHSPKPRRPGNRRLPRSLAAKRGTSFHDNDQGQDLDQRSSDVLALIRI
jgi:hypothetical protein